MRKYALSLLKKKADIWEKAVFENVLPKGWLLMHFQIRPFWLEKRKCVLSIIVSFGAICCRYRPSKRESETKTVLKLRSSLL